MNPNVVCEILQNIKYHICFPLCSPKITILKVGADHVEAKFQYLGVDRGAVMPSASYKSLSLAQIHTINTLVFNDEQDVLDWARTMGASMIIHEMEEGILFNGRRPFDPHT